MMLPFHPPQRPALVTLTSMIIQGATGYVYRRSLELEDGMHKHHTTNCDEDRL